MRIIVCERRKHGGDVRKRLCARTVVEVHEHKRLTFTNATLLFPRRNMFSLVAIDGPKSKCSVCFLLARSLRKQRGHPTLFLKHRVLQHALSNIPGVPPDGKNAG